MTQVWQVRGTGKSGRVVIYGWDLTEKAARAYADQLGAGHTAEPQPVRAPQKRVDVPMSYSPGHPPAQEPDADYLTPEERA